MNKLNELRRFFSTLGLMPSITRAEGYYDIHKYFSKNPLPQKASIGEFGDYSNGIIKKILSNLGNNNYTHLKYPEYDLLNLKNLSPKYDLFILDQILEHLPNPFLAADNILSHLRPNGIVISTSVFLYPLHYYNPDNKQDYFRYTSDGLKSIFNRFRIIKSSLYGGQNLLRYLHQNLWFEGGNGVGFQNNLLSNPKVPKDIFSDTNTDFGICNLLIAQANKNISSRPLS